MDQIEAGIEQFEWSIRLYLNENAYVPAITLAGAAEGIFGEIENGFIFHAVAERVSQRENRPSKFVKKDFNKIRNCLKHANKKSIVSFSDEELKAQAISRIIMTATALIHFKPDYISNLFIKFMQHTQTYYPDFLPDKGLDWNSLNFLEEEK